MLDRIQQLSRNSDYDFRLTASPEDPDKRLFEDWVEYYRTKWAVARALQPTSILEVGVRYGYSAAAFLHGCPRSRYVGIDLECAAFGGVKGAIQWAKRITEQFSPEFLIEDTQAMKSFPGGMYDLIHIDGQQDGEGSWHDLELAIKQGRYVLADGYFWTEQNFLSMSYFLHRFHDVIQWYGVIPGYAGDLLICVAPEYLAQMGQVRYENTGSGRIRDVYTGTYYLSDCGGFDQYARTGGKRIDDDARFTAVAAIATLKSSGCVLDIGCGRGELAHHFAAQGFRVTAIDYSPVAIELAEQTFRGEPELRRQVELICADACSAALSGIYDLVVASDVVEHLSPEELERLYSRVAKHLAKDGLFVVHTYPNRWFFQYDYPRRRKAAAALGSYLPPQPRTRYELLMHINEQSPRVLNRSLKRFFKDVVLWFANPEQPGGSLLESFSPHQACAARDLFCVASHSKIDREVLRNRFRSLPLPGSELSRIRLTLDRNAHTMIAGSEARIVVQISNGSPYVLSSCSPNPVHIAYHWIDASTMTIVVFEGRRSRLNLPINPGASSWCSAMVSAPAKPGRYLLRVTLVQEFVRWMDESPLLVRTDVPVEILPSLHT